jgi:hypothetical protein
MAGTCRCPAGHAMPAGPDRICPVCRRDRVITEVRKVETSLSTQDVVAAVDAVATNHAVWRSLAAALESDPDALAHGAPPAVGRLVTELIVRGSTALERAEMCGLRPHRSGVDGHRQRGHVCSLRAPRPSRRVCALRRRQTGRRAARRGATDLRAMPP